MNARVRVAFVMALVVVGLPLSGGTAASPAAAKVTAAYSSAAGSEVVLFAASDGGFFARNGLDVSMTRISGGSTTVIQVLASGTIDIAQIGGSAATNAAVRGVPVAIVADDYDRLIASMWAKDPGITSIRNLRNRTIGITNVGAITDFYARIALLREGLVPGRDVKLLAVGSLEACFAALSAGEVAACELLSPYTILAPKQGFHQIFDFLTVRVPFMLNGLVVTKRYVQEHRPTLVAFVTAYIQAITRLKADPAFGRQVLARHLQTNDQAAIDDAVKMYAGEYLRNPPLPNVQSIRMVIDIEKTRYPEYAGLDPRTIVDDSIVTEAEKALQGR
jgi:NitT/TauT family transport system substrate-binding protein